MNPVPSSPWYLGTNPSSPTRTASPRRRRRPFRPRQHACACPPRVRRLPAHQPVTVAPTPPPRAAAKADPAALRASTLAANPGFARAQRRLLRQVHACTWQGACVCGARVWCLHVCLCVHARAFPGKFVGNVGSLSASLSAHQLYLAASPRPALPRLALPRPQKRLRQTPGWRGKSRRATWGNTWWCCCRDFLTLQP